MVVEGFNIGTRFRVGEFSWANGSACSAEIVTHLTADGYKLRPATADEAIIDDRMQISPIQHIR
jgi:hypothetical protein